MDTGKRSPRYPWEMYVVAIFVIFWGTSWFISYQMTGAFHDKYGHEYRGQEAVIYSVTVLVIGIGIAAWSFVASRRVWKKRKDM